MKKIVVVAVLLAISISACSSLLPQIGVSQPTAVDFQATAAIQASTMSAETLAALPSPTVAQPTQSQTPVLLPSPVPTDTVAPAGNLTATNTPTSVPSVNQTITSTATPTALTGTRTLTPTLGVMLFGTQPPVPFTRVKLVNKSKAQAYISIQCTMPNKNVNIVEYPVYKLREIKAPVGKCLYVAWVGGNKMVGSFSLTQNIDAVITMYKEKVTIR